MATFWERAAYSVYHIFSFVFWLILISVISHFGILFFVCWLIVISVISHFGFEGGTLVLIAPISCHFLAFTFSNDAAPLTYCRFSESASVW